MRNLLCICAALAIMSCSTGEKQTEIKLKKVIVENLNIPNDYSKREFSFISKPFRESNLSFRIAGQIIKLDVQVGDYYSKGEVIACLDNRDYKIKKDKTEAKYIQAKAEYKRVEALYSKNNLSASVYDKAKMEMLFAKAEYETALNEYYDTYLKAPFDGYIQSISKDCYQDVKASEAIFYFINLDKMKIEANISEDIAINAKSINDVKLKFDSYPTQEFTASILNVSKSTSANNLSFLLTASFDNKINNTKMLGGMRGTISLVMPSLSSVNRFIVSQNAICNSPSLGSYVWVLNIKTMKVNRKKVCLASIKNNNKIEIITELDKDSLIVLSGHSLLSENEIVSF